MQTNQSSKSNKAAEAAPLSQHLHPTSTPQSTSITGSGTLQLQSVLANPSLPLTPSHILQLQKTIGNRAVTQFMKSRSQAAPLIQRAEMPDEELQMKLDPVVQRFRVGKIPPNAFNTAEVLAHNRYNGLVNAGDVHDAADFTDTMRNAIYTENDAHFNAAGGIVANPTPAAGNEIASDEDSNQLWMQRELTGQIANIDHIIPFDEWGSNDYRNARVVSQEANLDGTLPRTDDFQVVSYDHLTVNGTNFDRQEVLTVAKINHLLTEADASNAMSGADHDGGMTPINAVDDVTNNDLDAIYYDLPQE